MPYTLPKYVKHKACMLLFVSSSSIYSYNTVATVVKDMVSGYQKTYTLTDLSSAFIR